MLPGEAHSGKSPCPLVRDIIKQHIDETRSRLEELTRLLARMEKAYAQRGEIQDSIPDRNTSCILIESFED